MSTTLTLKLKSLYNKKGVVIDIDFLISYALFIFLVLILIQFVLSLMTPFQDNLLKISREKDTLAVSSLLINTLSINDFNSACSINYTNVKSLSVSYKIKGFFTPGYDYGFNYPNISEGVVFYREGDSMRLLVGNSGAQKKITVQLTADKPVSVSELILESEDNVTISYDSFNNQVIILESIVGSNDLDELMFNVNSKTLFAPLISGTDNIYLGLKPFNGSCGSKGILSPQTSFQRYGWLSSEQDIYPVIITGDVWWIS